MVHVARIFIFFYFLIGFFLSVTGRSSCILHAMGASCFFMAKEPMIQVVMDMLIYSTFLFPSKNHKDFVKYSQHSIEVTCKIK